MIRYKSPFQDIIKPKPVKGTRYRFEVALDSLRDREIIERLERHGNKSEYIRKLIRDDIKNSTL